MDAKSWGTDEEKRKANGSNIFLCTTKRTNDWHKESLFPFLDLFLLSYPSFILSRRRFPGSLVTTVRDCWAVRLTHEEKTFYDSQQDSSGIKTVRLWDLLYFLSTEKPVPGIQSYPTAMLQTRFSSMKQKREASERTIPSFVHLEYETLFAIPHTIELNRNGLFESQR